ncbi:MAG: 3-hydroxyacyl-CoA dehydrogenase NAD-binding domain-containing protein [Alphaproteobacteria bacterium]
MSGIESAAVVGAGVMGAAIAAHFANAGVPTLLLDVAAEGEADRSAIAKGAIARMLRTDPAPFMTRAAAKLVAPGNLDDDLDKLGEVDLIVEAVVEDLAIKQALYRRIDKARKQGSIVASNTSTLALGRLVEGLPKRLRRDFLITHFFNPPRYMRLLEMVVGPDTRANAVETVRDFADRRLGKGVVPCHDTPGFIANRIGAFWLQHAVAEAIERGLSVEEADAVMGRPVGFPKTGVFGLLDLVGLDLMPKVDASLAAALPAGDAYHDVRRDLPLIRSLIERGYTGRKGKGGFYRLNTDGGQRVKEAIDLVTGEHHPAVRPRPDCVEASKTGGLRALVDHPDKGGAYAWAVLSRTLAYAAALVPEIADDIDAVDRAMRLGYNWSYGPFELIDRLGAGYFAERLKQDDHDVPPLLATAAEAGGFYRVHGGGRQYLGIDGDYRDVVRGDGIMLLADIKLASEPLARNGSASLWDVGDGVVCLEIHTKMNTIDPEVFAILGKALKIVPANHKALVIYNEGEHFSAGVNLGLALFAANIAAWPTIEGLVAQGQETFKALKYAPFPVVGAPSGLALGGGCEILLHCDAIQAHAESYIGLVETGVGLVPGWGGCKELLARFASDPKRPRGPMPPVTAAFETIGLAKVARSAPEARELGFLRPTDGITFNRERLLAEAKAKALELAEDYTPPEPLELTLPGPSGRAALGLAVQDLRRKGVATAHDEVVAGALAEVLSGGPDADFIEPTGEDTVLGLERAALTRLMRTDATLARMEHTLETGKPLRN